ncbi:tRNA (cytidine(34)-2'-O)-methyltransferase [Posidoniimonas polymericola]|uniref:Putative tRNA (cytidine(34)-2'-O)-methyltransferase n=1 Tax=Posidoniimonas polymericola TaxID=2528002 RepID=A0A5C5YKN5_9BACT|nr:tRNA (cytidine(34)-2'-O)-methyltransferase [Posidoniimonas polymericola]TWT75473.1 tRNA (cytidine(34)-2'-O)-methyltransferase [Posidoniimonas polymericola]
MPDPTPATDPYEPRLHVVLYQPEIPYNTGSVGRTCVALGAKLWLVRPLGFQVDHHNLRRAGLDYWQHLAWEVVDDWRALTERLPFERFWCFTKFAKRNYTDARFQEGDVLLFGRESQGLPEEIRTAAGDRAVSFPTRSEVRSLNLSNCVAIAGYEALRQWESAG